MRSLSLWHSLPAAIRGGMDPDEAYSLSDYYIQRIESPDCTDLNNIMDIHFLAYDTFIHRVHEIQLQGKEYSPFVNDCIALIHRNIYEKDHSGGSGRSPRLFHLLPVLPV